MRHVFILLFFASVLVAQDRTGQLPSILASADAFASSGDSYVGGLKVSSPTRLHAYNIDSIDTNDLFIDAAGRVYAIAAISSRSLNRVFLTLSPQDTVSYSPKGKGWVWRPDSLGLIPVPAGVNGWVSQALQSKIEQHNLRALRDRTDITGGGPTSDTFNLRNPILRIPTAGQIIGGNSFADWAQWHYFTSPSLSLSGSSRTNEVGTSNSYTFTSTTTNPGAATLTGGRIEKNNSSVVTFGAATTGSYTYTFAPTGVVTETIRSEQEWSGAGESGTVNSNSRTLRGVYPVFYGVSSTDYSASGNIYPVLTKLVTTEGNKTVTMNGSGFIYYAVPVAWSDENLSSIIDANGFNVTPSFTSYTISVSSSGLTNDYTVDYLIYKLNTTTTVSNASYTFNR